MAFAADGHLDTTLSYSVQYISPCWPGPNPPTAVLLPHRTITAHQIAGIFSCTVDSAFIHVDGKF
jgi:acyl dehydratase